MKTKLKAIGDQVIVKPIDDELSKTIITVEQSKQRAQKGKVVAMGPGKLNATSLQREAERTLMDGVKPGDVVYFTDRYMGYDIEVDGETYRTLDISQIAAVVVE